MSIKVNKLIIKNQRDDRFLVKELSFMVSINDKLAIIGDEGSGKSTLLRILHGDTSLNYVNINGEIIKNGRSGYLEQNIKHKWGNFVAIDYLLLESPAASVEVSDYDKLAQLTKKLHEVGFLLERFDENKLIKDYSGGEVVKLGLVKILLEEVDVILLDEPSNDLDFEGIDFLINFMNKISTPIIFISHDQYLLEQTANSVIHLFQNRRNGDVISTYSRIDYVTYQAEREQKRLKDTMVGQHQLKEHAKKQERWRQIYQSVEHQQNQAVRDPSLGRLLKKKMQGLISQEKRFEREKEQFVPIPSKDEFIDLFFPPSTEIPLGKVILNFSLPKLMIGEFVLATNLDLTVVGPEHIVIIGTNGVGKTTLLRHIVHLLRKRADLKVGYMPQNYLEELDFNQKTLDYLLPNHDVFREGTVRKMMGSALFTLDETLAPIGALSGGSITKLFLLKMIIDECNVLILDEPTRNVSPLNIPEINRLLNQFKGTIICVSHDRYFIEAISTKTYILTKNGLCLN